MGLARKDANKHEIANPAYEDPITMTRTKLSFRTCKRIVDLVGVNVVT